MSLRLRMIVLLDESLQNLIRDYNLPMTIRGRAKLLLSRSQWLGGSLALPQIADPGIEPGVQPYESQPSVSPSAAWPNEGLSRHRALRHTLVM